MPTYLEFIELIFAIDRVIKMPSPELDLVYLISRAYTPEMPLPER
ncbi:hypothetical protein [Calothrix rhizosoleniae]|nr:hypothetical protein [Calothrix rhizosoleniae]